MAQNQVVNGSTHSMPYKYILYIQAAHNITGGLSNVFLLFQDRNDSVKICQESNIYTKQRRQQSVGAGEETPEKHDSNRERCNWLFAGNENWWQTRG